MPSHPKMPDTGKLLAVLPGHQDEVSALNFSPNSRYLVTADWSGTLQLWNIRGDLQFARREQRDRIYSADFSPNGKALLSASLDGTTCQADSLPRFNTEVTFGRLYLVPTDVLSRQLRMMESLACGICQVDCW
jgi:WD40 repeat protein